MPVGLDEPRQHQLAGHVHLHLAVVFAHTYNEALCHGDVPVTQLIGEYVDVSGVFQHQIRRSPARRHVAHRRGDRAGDAAGPLTEAMMA